MATNTRTVSPDGQRIGAVRPRPSALPVGQHRRLSWIVAGVLLVVGCALAFALASLRTGGRQQVLVVARAVPAGHVLASADLQTARISLGSGVQAVPADEEDSMVGRPVAVPLLPGTLLVAADVGPGSGVPTGFDVVAAPLKAGTYPPALAAGDRVRVVPLPASSTTPPSGGGTSAVTATVVDVTAAPEGSSADAVVSLQVADADADQVAALAAAGQVSLVQTTAGPGS